jgi:hypothetical protein
MMSRSTWWERLRGLFAACLLVVLASTPAIDAIVCQDNASISVSRSTAATTAIEQVGAPDPQHAGEGGEVCPHGHCHHFGVFLAADPASSLQAARLGAPPNGSEQRFPPSLPGATPERPPRV